MANEYVVGAPLRTGLHLADERYWGFCKVVVKNQYDCVGRHSMQQDSFIIKLSEHNLATTEDYLWDAITARVQHTAPFRTWERVEAYFVVKNVNIVHGRRTVHKFDQWPTVQTWTEEEETDASEQGARDMFADVQNELCDNCHNPPHLTGQTQDWTIVIYR